MGKVKNITSLKNRLDRIFSVFIRIRDADNNGYCRCHKLWEDRALERGRLRTFRQPVTYGYQIQREKLQRSSRSCNRFDEGNNIGYAKGLINKYGIKVINELEVKKHSISKLSAFDYQLMIEDYKKRIKDLRDQKGIKD